MIDTFECEDCKVIETDLDFDFKGAQEDGRVLCQRCRETIKKFAEEFAIRKGAKDGTLRSKTSSSEKRSRSS